MTPTFKPRCTESMCHRRQYRRGLCHVHYKHALEHVPGFRIGQRGTKASDLLALAFHTGRIHADRGGRCAVDTCAELFGERAARAYEAGYRSEIARAAAA